MPIYMDRHEVPENITAEHVAQMHQADLKVQHLYGCKGLTYWCDENRNTAFCLIDAPNEKALQEMHNHAHGELPHSIIEVDAKLVESFLGRIEDPEKSAATDLHVIDDSAFRILMMIGLKRPSLANTLSQQDSDGAQQFNEKLSSILSDFYGVVVKQNAECSLVSFISVTKAVMCALELQNKFKEAVNNGTLELKIGLSAGEPVTHKKNLFEDTIKMIERMYDVAGGSVIVSTVINELYKSENRTESIDEKLIQILKPAEERFLNSLMDYTEKIWTDTDLTVDDFSKNLGLSKSQLYRKMISLSGKSPNTFIKEYRLNKALKMLKQQQGNISEIAFDTGFNSPSYFSKCFLDTYGILPSAYSKEQSA